MIDNKFGTPNPIPFRVVDSKIGLDIDVSVRCSGVYSYKIADPLLFYTNVCGNVDAGIYPRRVGWAAENGIYQRLAAGFSVNFPIWSCARTRLSAIIRIWKMR